MLQRLESRTINGKVVWQTRVISDANQQAYMNDFAVNAGLLAVTDPLSPDLVHLLDTHTGHKLSQLDEFHNVTVGITGNGHLIVAEGIDSRARKPDDRNPTIWSGLPDSPNSFKPLRWVDGPPQYHQYIGFPKILDTHNNQAVISGETDSYQTGGFLLLADWNKSDPGELTTLYEGVENGPQDIAVRNNLVYIADKDTPSIKAISLNQAPSETIDIPGRFNPVRIATTEDFLVVTSYNELYFLDQFNRRGRQRFGSEQDNIQGLAALAHNRVTFTLSSSGRLMVKDLSRNTSQSVKLDKLIEEPCFVISDPQLSNRIYVSGYMNGTISAIDLEL